MTRRLKKIAEEAAKIRGHTLDRWINSGTTARAVCKACNMQVTVNSAPAPNEIDLGGSVLALYCTGKKP
jgi:hypothetical protein